MIHVLNWYGYGVLLSALTPMQIKTIKNQLTVSPKIDDKYNTVEKKFPVYRCSSLRLYVPRFYGVSTFGAVDDTATSNNNIDVAFNGALKPNQQEYVDIVLAQILEKGSCIACSETGSGKTVMALWLLSQIGKKTIIVVNSNVLLEQWRERIQHFLPNATIGVIRGELVENDKDISLCMIQSLSKKKYEKDFFTVFNFSIFDECHHVGSQVFSNSFYKCRTRYSLGLSATPDRKDGLTFVIRWFLGEIVTCPSKSTVKTPTVHIHHTRYTDVVAVKNNCKGQLNLADLINKIVKIEDRNKHIVDVITELHKSGRKILVLTARREHCATLHNMINDDRISGIYIGGMKKEELDESNKKMVIFATYQSAGEGYDNPDLDTLVMATSIVGIKQPVGRILRKDNAFAPLIVDFVDKDFLYGQHNARVRYYRLNNFAITTAKPRAPR
jgi:superfamily II DNA or RNA helicase